MNRKILSFLLGLFLLGAGVYLLSTNVLQLYFISGSSMEPAYTSGQPVLVRKWGLPHCISYGDVVIIHQKDLHRDIVKRIVGLPGDTILIQDGILYVNDIPEESADSLPVMENAGNAASPVLLGAGEYFVLGDNRNRSIDSRFDEIGIISGPSITGKIICQKLSP